jgi:hypothetical protein
LQEEGTLEGACLHNPKGYAKQSVKSGRRKTESRTSFGRAFKLSNLDCRLEARYL